MSAEPLTGKMWLILVKSSGTCGEAAEPILDFGAMLFGEVVPCTWDAAPMRGTGCAVEATLRCADEENGELVLALALEQSRSHAGILAGSAEMTVVSGFDGPCTGQFSAWIADMSE